MLFRECEHQNRALPPSRPDKSPNRIDNAEPSPDSMFTWTQISASGNTHASDLSTLHHSRAFRRSPSLWESYSASFCERLCNNVLTLSFEAPPSVIVCLRDGISNHFARRASVVGIKSVPEGRTYLCNEQQWMTWRRCLRAFVSLRDSRVQDRFGLGVT